MVRDESLRIDVVVGRTLRRGSSNYANGVGCKQACVISWFATRVIKLDCYQRQASAATVGLLASRVNPMNHPQCFGLLIPGLAVVTQFEQVDSTKLVATVANPGDAGELVFFLLPGMELPAHMSVVLYYTVEGTAWTVIGAITSAKPSGIFRTPWRDQCTPIQAVTVGVSIESASTVQNLHLLGSGVDDRRAFARKIARDLSSFIGSFSTTADPAEQLRMAHNAQEVLILPANVLDRWIARFDAKYERDPNFYLK